MPITEIVLAGLFSKLTDDLTKTIDNNSEKTKIVTVKQNPDGFNSTELDYAETMQTKFGTRDNPNLEFENILEKESIVKEISMIPDESFTTKGKVIVTIDDSVVFRNKKFDSFRDLGTSVIKINKKISQDSKVKFFIISQDGTLVRLTAQVTFGE